MKQSKLISLNNKMLNNLKRLSFLLLLSCFFLFACADKQEQERKYLERAQSAYDLANYDKTRVELKNVLQINPKNMDARYLQALLAEKDQDWRKMYGILSAVVQEKPDHFAAQIKLGMLYLLSGQLDKAMENVELVLAVEPENIQALILKSAVLTREDKLVEAEQLANKILSLDPGNAESTFILVKLFSQKKQFDKSLALIDSSLAVHPEQLNLSLLKVRLLMATENKNAAEQLFSDLVNRHPDNSALHYNFAKFYLAAGELNKAEQVLRDYVALKPEEYKPKLALIKYLLAQKQATKAEATLSGFIKAEPENYIFQFALADIYKDQPERAIPVLDGIIEQDEDGVNGLKAKNQLARYAIKEGNRDQARQLVDEIIEVDSGNIDALMLRSSMLIDGGDYDAAIADLRTVLRSRPDSEQANVLSAAAQLQRGYSGLAQESLHRALTINPENSLVRRDLAKVMVKNKDDLGAISLLEEANKPEKHDLKVQAMLVDLYIRNKEWEKAEKLAKEIADEDQDLSHLKLAQIYFTQKNYQSAVDEYLQLLKSNPLDIKLLAALTGTYMAMDKPDKAEKMLDELITNNPKDDALLNLRGALYKSQDQLADAEKYFKQAIATNAQSVAGYRNLASIYVRQKNLDAAIEVYRQGITALPENLPLMLGLGSLYEVNKNTQEAMDLYTDILKFDSENTIAANNLAVMITNNSDDPERLNYALELVQPFENNKNPAILDTYGWVNFLHGNDDEALIALEKVVELNNKVPEFYYHLGMVYAKKGRVEEAKLALRKAVADENNFPGVDKAREKLKSLETL